MAEWLPLGVSVPLAESDLDTVAEPLVEEEGVLRRLPLLQAL